MLLLTVCAALLTVTLAEQDSIRYSSVESVPIDSEVQFTRASAERSRRQVTAVPPVIEVDTHEYYRLLYINDPLKADTHWVQLDKNNGAVVHQALSAAHRTASVVHFEGKFKFQYYGHELTKVTVATGGFLYMGSFLHQFLTVTQYAAPLMANFDTSIDQQSQILYLLNSTHAVFEWRDVYLKDDEAAGPFHFQCVLHANGQIDFVYRMVPKHVELISGAVHPVKLGIADAFYEDIYRNGQKIRAIEQYHSVDVNKTLVQTKSVFIFYPLATCMDYASCGACVSARLPAFNCSWCPLLNRCGSGMDRGRAQWIDHKCHEILPYTAATCAKLPTTTAAPGTTAKPTGCGSFQDCPSCVSHYQYTNCQWCDKLQKCANVENQLQPWYDAGCHIEDKWIRPTCLAPRPVKQASSNKSSVSGGGIVAIVLFLLVVLCLGGWLLFAYRNPESRSGQFMIKNRPSELWNRFKTWRRGGDPAERYAPGENSSGAPNHNI